uniref:ATP synthase complex subunit 8 n=1 Tax=Paranephrops planifrons TaxID=99774 RepID=A0A0A8WDU1_9EUCA|nr:ATP synthase F0 subunit 8 [Paranephrops planifrons]CEK40184.1 ATP synthase F0 subunit 8 [Paranephrops planifrons]
MPQMSPLFWLNLFIFFLLGFLLFIITNYFIKPPLKVLTLSENLINLEKTWKW